MNIGMFTDTFYPQINGLVTSLTMLETELEKRGHNVFIFTTSNPSVKDKSPNVFRLPSVTFKMSPQHRVAIVYPPRLLLKMRKFDLDIIHTHSEFPLGIFGRLLSEVYRLPLVHTYHTLWEEYVHYFGDGRIITKEMARRYSRVFCNGADAIICPTEKTENILRSYGVNKPMSVIPTGIDFAPFSKERHCDEEVKKTRAELGIPDGSPVLLTIGRIAREKSIDMIIESMPEILERIPELKFVVIGDGPALNDLKALACTLGIGGSVIFGGARPWCEIGKYYRLGDVFISASTSETQGLTYIEAMAAGVTVVVRRDESTDGIIIDNETGFYFEGKQDMAEVICNAMRLDPEKRREINENAAKSIQHMSAENFATCVEAFYMTTIDRINGKKTHKFKFRRLKFPLRLPDFRKKSGE